MKILAYDRVDPVEAFHITMLALGFALTPELVEHIQRTSSHQSPCLSVCAVEDAMVVGHAGVFRQPVLTIKGWEDVGVVWAVCSHPQYTSRGIASRLLEEAHACMRAIGLRFSMLNTNRSLSAYRLFRRMGYADMEIWATAMARWETAHQPTRLRAAPPGDGGYDLVEQVFRDAAGGRLGFTARQMTYSRLKDSVRLEDVQILWENDRPVGYALTSVDQSILYVRDLILKNGVNPGEAAASLASRLKTAYVHIKVSRPVEIASLRQAGYQIAHPDWSAFLVKPLAPDVTLQDARRIFGIGTDRFLISWMDMGREQFKQT